MTLENSVEIAGFASPAEVFRWRRIYGVLAHELVEYRLNILREKFDLGRFEPESFAIFRYKSPGASYVLGQQEHVDEILGFAARLRRGKIRKIFVFADLHVGFFTIERIEGKELLRKMPIPWKI